MMISASDDQRTANPTDARARKSRGSRKGISAPLGRDDATQQRESVGALVKLNRYCAVTGDTAEAVHTRRKRGEWIDGKHCHLVSRRRLWIDMAEVHAWICSHSRA